MLVLGPVHGEERVALQWQPLARAQLRGQRIEVVDDVAERVRDEGADALRRYLLARGVDRREVRGRLALPHVVGLHVEAVATRLAAQAHVCPRPELLLEPRLVEPRRRDGGGAVRDPRRDDLQPPAPPGADVQHLPGDRNLLATAERRDRDLLNGRLVAVRPVLEEVADRVQAELRELALQGDAHARQRVELPVEPLGTRTGARGRPGRRRVQAGEDRLSTECCHRARRQSDPKRMPRSGRISLRP